MKLAVPDNLPVVYSEDHPALRPLVERVVLVTDRGTARTASHRVEDILAFLEGKPRFVVNPDALKAGR